MKTRQDNNVADCIGMISAEYDIELSWLFKKVMVYDKD